MINRPMLNKCNGAYTLRNVYLDEKFKEMENNK